MRSFRSKPVGWRGESHRHYLAAKGIKTKKERSDWKNDFYAKKENWPVKFVDDNGEVKTEYFKSKSEANEFILRQEREGRPAVGASKGYYSQKYYAYTPTYVGADLAPIGADAIGTAGASVVPWIPVAVPLLLAYGGAKYVKNRKGKGFFAEKEEMIEFTPTSLNEFDKKLAEAKVKGDESFIFEGKPVLVSYGKYVSEFVHKRFERQKPMDAQWEGAEMRTLRKMQKNE